MTTTKPFAYYLHRHIFIFSTILLLNACVTEGGIQSNFDRDEAVDAHVKLGLAYLQRRNRDGAMRAFNEAYELNRRDPDVHYGFALMHQMAAEYELAEESFKKSIRLPGGESVERNTLAYSRFLFERERYEEAHDYLNDLTKSVAFKRRAEAIMLSGLVSLKLGEKARAESQLVRAVKLNPKLATAHLELADLYFTQRNYAKAKRHLDQFGSLQSHTPRSLWLGIRIERIFGNKDKEASYALALKNLHPYSKQYLDYKRLLERH